MEFSLKPLNNNCKPAENFLRSTPTCGEVRLPFFGQIRTPRLYKVAILCGNPYTQKKNNWVHLDV